MTSYHHHISQLKNYISLSSGTNAAADLTLSAIEDKAFAGAAGQPRAQTSPCTRHVSLVNPENANKDKRKPLPSQAHAANSSVEMNSHSLRQLVSL